MTVFANARGRLAGMAIILVLPAILAVAAPLAAQGVSTAGLRGRVLDRYGAAIEAALVTLEHTGTGATNTAITTPDGRYTLRGLRPGGPYTMTVTLIGFGDHTREEIELLLGRFVNLDVTLVPEAVVIEGIEVEVQQDIEFDPGRIGISTLVTAEIIEELPTLTRNFVDFAALSPLARVSKEGVSVAGTNYRFNTLNVDGALNQDVFGLSTENVAGGRAGGRVIPLEAVEQFQVLVAPFDVRQSGFTGGAMNAVTSVGNQRVRDIGVRVLPRRCHDGPTGDQRCLHRSRSLHRARRLHGRRPAAPRPRALLRGRRMGAGPRAAERVPCG